MARRIFTLADQLAFAELSGDNNPVHIDPVSARRSLFGQPIVHGIHALLWALDQWLEGHTTPVRLRHLRVAFSKQIGLRQEVRLAVVSQANNQVRIDIIKENETAVRMLFECVADEPGRFDEVLPKSPETHPPEVVETEAIQACRGTLDLCLQPELAHRLFPNLSRFFCPVQAAALLGLSRVVGVKCPGLHSIFSELKLTAGETGDLKKIQYAVSEFHERHGLVLLAVASPGLQGIIRAFVRPQPRVQPSFLEVKKLVGAGSFASQRALIVGGSRGLGEVTAKLLAAGGAEVQLTYRQGKADAEKIRAEIIEGGGQASLCELDVLQSPPAWPGRSSPTHLYYFASPLIAGSEKMDFSSASFNLYCNYYVNGFAAIVEPLRKYGLRHVFYPSTVFIDEAPARFLEYTLAKHAGELLCHALQKQHPEMRFYCPRLPKMATDQTANFSPVQNPDPAPIILAALQDFKDSDVSMVG